MHTYVENTNSEPEFLNRSRIFQIFILLQKLRFVPKSKHSDEDSGGNRKEKNTSVRANGTWTVYQSTQFYTKWSRTLSLLFKFVVTHPFC